jgi:superfamily II DNA/RNA helicase
VSSISAVGFAELGLSVALVRAVAELGFRTPTAVQAAAVPVILKGGDVLASSRTGSGKTAAFVLPVLERLGAAPASVPRTVRGLVLVPTRELASQIVEAVQVLARHMPHAPKLCLGVGGVSINPQMLALRGGADLVVATPGRLLDLVDKNALQVSSVQVLVLDEADRLLSAGFAEELDRVFRLLPAARQTLLFSATLPERVRRLADTHLREPTCINVDCVDSVDKPAIKQRAIVVDADKRTLLLRHLLDTHEWSQVLVFAESRHRANHLARKLSAVGIRVAALHGDLSQGARTRALGDLKAKQVQVLIATDVAARGLDIPQLAAVVNYDLPRSPADYVHRIGRTGRAGEAGVAVSFISAGTEPHFRLIEKRNHFAVEREQIQGFEAVDQVLPVIDPHGGRKGRRKSKKDKLREAVARDSEPPRR